MWCANVFVWFLIALRFYYILISNSKHPPTLTLVTLMHPHTQLLTCERACQWGNHEGQSSLLSLVPVESCLPFVCQLSHKEENPETSVFLLGTAVLFSGLASTAVLADGNRSMASLSGTLNTRDAIWQSTLDTPKETANVLTELWLMAETELLVALTFELTGRFLSLFL